MITSSAYESADLLLRLYDLRREPTLRAARDWFFFHYHPQSVDEVFETWLGPDSDRYRMVTTYWDMAAALVRRGAIDADMFHATNGEYITLVAKLEPFLPELRRRTRSPEYLLEVETLVREMPDSERRLEMMRRYLARKREEHERALAS